MKNRYFGKISAFTTVVLIAAGLQSNVSQAFIGLPFIGLSVVAVGVVVGVAGQAAPRRWQRRNAAETGAGLALFGILLLDDNSAGLTPVFQTLDTATAAKMNITAEELTAYNSELDEVNAVAATIASETAATATDDASAVTMAHEMWAQNANAFSTETMSALTKISTAYAAAQ